MRLRVLGNPVEGYVIILTKLFMGITIWEAECRSVVYKIIDWWGKQLNLLTALFYLKQDKNYFVCIAIAF